MPNFRRNFVAGGIYFFTVVTLNRRPILATDAGRTNLYWAIEFEQKVFPFEQLACVVLPDHIHAIWRLPDGDFDYPNRWKRIKTNFTKAYLRETFDEGTLTPGRTKKGDRGVWQARYWEHTVRNEDDLERCIDYIHWNPVKHGFVRRAADYPYSTFRRFVKRGDYNLAWGEADPGIAIAGAEWD